MTKLFSSIILAASILAASAPAQAYPGDALREQAQSGSITPHGVFDSFTTSGK